MSDEKQRRPPIEDLDRKRETFAQEFMCQPMPVDRNLVAWAIYALRVFDGMTSRECVDLAKSLGCKTPCPSKIWDMDEAQLRRIAALGDTDE